MHTLLEQHKDKLYSFILIFLCSWFCLGFLWSVVLLITYYLLEPIFNVHKEYIEEEKHFEQSFRSKYKSSTTKVVAKNYYKSPQNFWEKKNISTFSSEPKLFNHFKSTDTMFTQKRKSTGTGEPKPTLMSLIHGKSNVSKENYGSPKQPIVALVKNNISLRRSSSSSRYSPKRPLYENYRSPLHNHVFTPSPLSRRHESNTDERNDSLSLHGTYLVNKSILTSNFDKTSPNNNNQNKSMESPFTRIDSYDVNEHIDSTSKDSVVSILKQKSKRKRSCATQSPPESSTKKARFNDLTNINSTLDDLFSTSPKTYNGRLPRKRSASTSHLPNPKKAMISIATQFDSPQLLPCQQKMKRDWNEKQSIVPQQKTSKRSKRIGLTERETNDLMINDNESPAVSNRDQKDTLSEKSSHDDIPASEKSSLQDSTLDETDSRSNETSINNVSDTSSSKMTNNLSSSLLFNDLNRTDALNESLRKLKSPFKRIVPDSFKSSAREKLRKYPVFFTAKIDIDEIQSRREEYGMKGVSLRSYRLERELAAKRTEELFNEECEETTTIVTKSTAPGLTIPSVVLTVPTPTVSLNVTPAVSNETTLSTSNESLPKSGFSFTVPTATTIAQSVASTISFSFGASSKSESVSLPSFTVTNTTATSTAPSFNFGLSAAVSSAPQTITSISSTTFKIPSSSVATSSAPTIVVSSQPSLPSLFSTPAASIPAVTAASSVTTNPTSGSHSSATTFSFFPSVSNTPSNPATTTTTNVLNTGIAASSVAVPSFTFGAINTIPKSTSQPTFNAPSVTSASVFPSVAPNMTSSSVFPVTSASLFPVTSASVFPAGSEPSFLSNSLPQSNQPPSNTATTVAQFPAFNPTPATSANIFGQSSNPIQSTSGFSFGSASAPSFNFGGTSAGNAQPSFGVKSSNSVPSFNFGAPSTSAAPSTASNNIFSNFGAKPNPSVAPSVFANIPSVQSSNGPSMFATNTFSSTSTNSLFGNTVSQTQSKPPPSVFASIPTTGGNIFGQQPTSTPSVFNQSTSNTPFQFKPNPTATQPNTGGFNFGSSNVNPFSAPTQNATPSFFGAHNNAQPAAAPFGNAKMGFGSTNNNPNPFNTSAPATKANGFDFSPSLKQTPSFLGGGGSAAPAFNKEPPKPTFNFNPQPAATPMFGAPSTPSFMQAPQQNAFGTPSTPNFGGASNFAPAPNFGGGFSMGTGAPANREKARPRRRKR